MSYNAKITEYSISSPHSIHINEHFTLQPRRKLIQPAAFYCCYFFCSRDWMRVHLSNDWLAGCWFIFWGTLMATIVCLVLFLKSMAEDSALQAFIFGTS